MKEDNVNNSKNDSKKNRNAVLVLIIVIVIMMIMYNRLKSGIDGEISIMPIIILIIFITVMSLIMNKRKYKNKYINTKLRKEMLKKLFPKFYVEEDILEDEIKQTKLNVAWENFWDEGTLEIKDEEEDIKIYKYFTTKLDSQNREVDSENGIMIKFCNGLKSQFVEPVYIKKASDTEFYQLERGIGYVGQKLYDIAGLDGKPSMLEEKVEFENDEFNQYFSVRSNNAVHAKMIVTYEKMEKLLKLREELDKEIEIAYIGHDIYMWVEDMELVKRTIYKFTYNVETYEQFKKIIAKLPNIKKCLSMNEIL